MANAGDQPGGTLGMMEELERQLQLRDEESREFQEWQESMIAVGTPEAIAAVQKVRPRVRGPRAPASCRRPSTRHRLPPPPVSSRQPAAPPTCRHAAQAPPPSSLQAAAPPSAADCRPGLRHLPPLIEPPALVEPTRPEPWAIAEGNVVPDPYHDEQDQGVAVGACRRCRSGGHGTASTPPDVDTEVFVDPAFAGPSTGSVSVLTGCARDSAGAARQ